MNISTENTQDVLRQLRAVLPGSSLITDAAGLKPYETDGLTAIREVPWLVVLPTTEQQVVEVVNICRKSDVPSTAWCWVCRK
jgi:glycolate oxidase